MSASGAGHVTALVVDDDPAMRALLRDWLEREGFGVLEEPGGEELLTAARGTAAFDVVILDKEMPGVTGLDVLPTFRALRPDVPVILVTAFGGAQVAEEALKLGVHRYLEKPFQLRTLIETVRAAIAAPARDGDESGGRARP